MNRYITVGRCGRLPSWRSVSPAIATTARFYSHSALAPQRHACRSQLLPASPRTQTQSKRAITRLLSGSDQQNSDDTTKSATAEILEVFQTKWAELSLQQQCLLLLSTAVGLVLAWKLATIGVVLAERIFIGSLLALEEVLLLLLTRGIALVGGVGFVALLLYTTYTFIKPPHTHKD